MSRNKCQHITVHTAFFVTHHVEGLQQGKVDEIHFILAFVFPSFFKASLSIFKYNHRGETSTE